MLSNGPAFLGINLEGHRKDRAVSLLEFLKDIFQSFLTIMHFARTVILLFDCENFQSSILLHIEFLCWWAVTIILMKISNTTKIIQRKGVLSYSCQHNHPRCSFFCILLVCFCLYGTGCKRVSESCPQCSAKPCQLRGLSPEKEGEIKARGAVWGLLNVCIT